MVHLDVSICPNLWSDFEPLRWSLASLPRLSKEKRDAQNPIGPFMRHGQPQRRGAALKKRNMARCMFPQISHDDTDSNKCPKNVEIF